MSKWLKLVSLCFHHIQFYYSSTTILYFFHGNHIIIFLVVAKKEVLYFWAQKMRSFSGPCMGSKDRKLSWMYIKRRPILLRFVCLSLTSTLSSYILSTFDQEWAQIDRFIWLFEPFLFWGLTTNYGPKLSIPFDLPKSDSFPNLFKQDGGPDPKRIKSKKILKISKNIFFLKISKKFLSDLAGNECNWVLTKSA